jgi:hypothetical protein
VVRVLAQASSRDCAADSRVGLYSLAVFLADLLWPRIAYSSPDQLQHSRFARYISVLVLVE